jgi:hypothetical protein
MDAAECSADAGVCFDEVDAAIEIVAAEKDVIENGGHFDGSPRNKGRCEGGSGYSQKSTTRKHLEPLSQNCAAFGGVGKQCKA